MLSCSFNHVVVFAGHRVGYNQLISAGVQSLLQKMRKAHASNAEVLRYVDNAIEVVAAQHFPAADDDVDDDDDGDAE